MRAEDFTERLAASAPTVQQLRSVGLSTDEAAVFAGSYHAKARPDTAAKAFADPLLDWVSRFDVREIEIGMMSFGPLAPKDSVWEIGRVETDPIVVDRASGEVEVRDSQPTGRTLWKCARNGEAFLEAALLAAAFLARCAYDAQLSEDAAKRRATAADCARAAGGSEYESFYLMLLGCD